MNQEQAFQQAAHAGDSAKMLYIAETAIAQARTKAESQRWRKRLSSLRSGKILKFSRAEVRDVR